MGGASVADIKALLYQPTCGLEKPVIMGKVGNNDWGVAFAAKVGISNWYHLLTALLSYML